VVALGAAPTADHRAFAACRADVVLLAAPDPGTARRSRDALLGDAGRAGRSAGPPLVLIQIAATFADTRAEVLDSYAPMTPSGTAALSGYPGEVARMLVRWQAETGADGFHLLPSAHAVDLPAIVHGLAPRLREHGLFRARYTGRTLRDHLGLPAGADTAYGG
jgi:alkanesulfonate monooxygenase SsuD/methylene tetrahydromethanopterin reductase-like flavin-dependent oxidoreductase (luciferase family)